LQPGELYRLYEGYLWRQEQEEKKHERKVNLTAYFTACAMSVHTKRPVNPQNLLKPLRQTKKVVKHDRKADEEYLRQQFGLSGGETSGNGS
jgi:hypothetical protein